MSLSRREHYFWGTDFSHLSEVSVILDVDNTVMAAGEEHPRKEAVEKVHALLKNKNRVYLCSNFKDHHRNETVAHYLGIPYLRTPYLKPSPKVIEAVPIARPIVVIGDKFLTDGMFAKNIDSLFIKVRSVISKKEPLYGLISVIIDSIVGRAVYRLYANLSAGKTR